MQVVGASLALDAVRVVASRSTRAVVREWAERVLYRHIKRTPELHVPVPNLAKLDAIMAKESLPQDARTRIREAFKAGEPFFSPSASALVTFLRRASDTMDYVESLSEDDRRIRRIDRMGWMDADGLAAAWHASVKKHGQMARNLLVGTRRLMEFRDGSFAADLQTKEALAAEGNAMGHCVGGYWDRVSRGSTRIVSIRDKANLPHVTIELATAPRMRLDGGEPISVSHRPRKGRDVVSVVSHDWVAVQIRGKSNAAPVEKWQKIVDEWLSATGTPYREFGGPARTAGGKSFEVFTIGDRSSLDPDSVSKDYEPEFLEAVRKNPNSFQDIYRTSGLGEIHRFCADRERVVEQSEIYLPIVMDGMSRRMADGSAFQMAFAASGASSVLQQLGADSGVSEKAKRRILDLAVESDATATSRKRIPIVELSGKGSVDLIQHELPLLPLMMLSLGVLTGFEDEVAGLTAPVLASTLEVMRRNTGAMHNVCAARGGLKQTDLVGGFMLCGLAADYGAVSKAVDAGVRASVKDLRLVARKLRSMPGADQGRINYVGNIIGDGYENRLKEMAARVGKSGGMVFSPAHIAPVTNIHRIAPVPVMKAYKMPSR